MRMITSVSCSLLLEALLEVVARRTKEVAGATSNIADGGRCQCPLGVRHQPAAIMLLYLIKYNFDTKTEGRVRN